MQQYQPDYKIYATLLDAYQWYRVSESDAAAQELIDKINRVRTTDVEAVARMNRGTALNQLVDMAVENGFDKVQTSIMIDGVEYSFPEDLIEHLALRLAGAITQYQCKMRIVVSGGKLVELYGYLDYLHTDKVIDLKATSSYDIGKYKDSMQRHLYPLCLIYDGHNVESFEFIAVEIKSAGCNVFSESYPLDMNESMAVICEAVAGLIEFVEAKRDQITDTKIFGIDPPGILATPIPEGMPIESL